MQRAEEESASESDQVLMFSRGSPGITWVTDAHSIRNLRKKGRLFRGGSVYAWISRKEDASPGNPQVSVVTGRGFTLSTSRNLARRRVRGCILDLRHLLEEGNCYLVQCRPGVEHRNYQKLVNEVRGILSKAGKTEKKETAGYG